jgi:hypothetical protein
MDHTTGVQNASRPGCLCQSPQSLIHIHRRELVQVSADDHVRPPIDPARDKFKVTLPVATWNLIERHNRYDCVRVGCHEQFKIELGKEGQARSLGKNGNLTSREP